MKTLSQLFFLSIVLLMFNACSENSLCEQEVRYVRATAIYADLDDFRINEINSTPRSLARANKIFVSDDLILISERQKGIHIYDNSNPENPTAINFLNIPGNNEMFIEDNVLYADSYYDMVKIDITNPRQAFVVSRIEEAFEAKFVGPNNQKLIGFDEEVITEKLSCDAFIQPNDHVYMDFNRERITDSAIPTAFVANGNGSVGTANRIAKKENLIFVIDRSTIYTFEDGPSFAIGSPAAQIGWDLETIYSLDDHLFMGSNNGMHIYRVEGNNEVSHQGDFFHETACDPVLPTTENVAYLTLRSGDECPGDINSLSVIDISNYNFTSLLQQIEMESPFGMTLHQDKLYVGEGTNGFKVFDASQPGFLSEISSNSSIETYDIIPHPSRENILLFASPSGIAQYQATDDNYTHLSSILY